MTFATMEEKFNRANCKLVGLSVDGLYSHIAWLRTIKEKIEYKGMKDVEVTFPLIEDITMNVAKKYGMIQPNEDNTKAVRAVFFIDPKGIIRTIIYYPLSLSEEISTNFTAYLLRFRQRMNSALLLLLTGDREMMLSFRRQEAVVLQKTVWKVRRMLNVKTGSSVRKKYQKMKY